MFRSVLHDANSRKHTVHHSHLLRTNGVPIVLLHSDENETEKISLKVFHGNAK